MTDWDYIRPSDVSDGKKAGRAYCGWNTVGWDAANEYIDQSASGDADNQLSLCNRWLNPTDHPIWSVTFKLARTSAQIISMAMTNQAVTTHINWYTDGKFYKYTPTYTVYDATVHPSDGTWVEVTINYNYTAGSLSYSINGGSTDTIYSSGISWTNGINLYLFDTNCRVKDITWNITRPTNDGTTYLAKI